MSALVGIAMIVGAVLFLFTTAAYVLGGARAYRELDDTFEIAKALGAYGVFVRLEAEALGITVEEVVARDAALTRMSGEEIVENVHRSNARRLGGTS